VDAVPGEVEPSTDEPPRPLDPARGVDDLLPRLGELDAEVFDHDRPKPLRLLDRDAVEIVIPLDPEAACEPRQVRAFDVLGHRSPDELVHAEKAI
jgi:hypothetical protein